MKKVLIHISLIITFIVIYLLQSIFFSHFTIAGIMPNMFVIFMMFIGLYMGRTMGTIYGIMAGILIDFWVGKNIGLTSVALALIGIISGALEKTLSKDSRITILLMGVICTIIYEIALYFLQFIVLGINVEILNFIKILLIETIYNILLIIILYPIINNVGYEVENEIYIIGNVKEKGKFNSKYRIKIANKNEAESFFTLLKALFIITTESNYRYSFEPIVNEKGEIVFLFDGKEIKTADLANFIKEQTGKMNDDHDKLIEKTNENKEKLLKEREEISKLNEIYLNQEKQIAMFLNCRKSFFKKLRYYFTDTKHEKKSFKSKKKPAKDDGKQELEKKVEKTLNNSISAYKPTTSAYTISDLMKACSETNSAEEEYINSQSDLNAAILKHKNMKLKVHNADKYIEEIEEHKKSIFEFWKFTNKDELPALKEGETIQKDQKIKAVFNYDEDIIELGEKADRLQRQKLSNDECNSICASLQVVNSINSVIDNKEELLKQDLKRLQDEYTGDIKTEIFGEIKDDYTVVKKLNNKQHRENKRNIYSILRINSQTTIEDYRNTIEDYARLLNESYNKIVAITDFPVYYLKSKETKENDYIIADINPDNIINIAQSGDTIVKRNIRKDEHIIYASNIIFYDNYNKTLPVGMNVSTLVIIKDEEKKQKCSNINIVEENDEFSIKIKKLNIIELE